MDEVVLAVYPILLGAGKRFFSEGTPARAFELVGKDAMPSRVIFSNYRVAGPLKAGSFDALVSLHPGVLHARSFVLPSDGFPAAAGVVPSNDSLRAFGHKPSGCGSAFSTR